MKTETPIRSTIDATQLPARERWSRAARALARVLQDPEQTDQVLVFSTYANAGSMPDRIHRFLDDSRGRRLYEEHRTIDAKSIDLPALATLPAGTLGRAYAEFLSSRGLTPDVFENPPEDITDPVMAYVIQRLRQTHDLWHVVTGYNTDPASEVALQAFTFGQLQAPSSGILAVLGTIRGSSLKPGLALDVMRAFRLGRRTEKLAIFPWEDHWSTPLVEVRRMLGLPEKPEAAERLGNEVRELLAAMTPAAAATTWGARLATDATATVAAPTTTPSPMAASQTTSPTVVPALQANDAGNVVPSIATPTTSKRLLELVHTAGVARRHKRAIRRARRANRLAAA